ncbi:TrmH family RNA methyltransferase [Mongoliitalea daihaiensis]|uniref:TrmH family RNA methyltransferase n=1 Tax=Mongoliitalea daihaiensis TaxID=2782006 RepID=UPI001F39B403|nr:RNA methyltransferase [Mongoliitalea daihaiensis]UJP64092.1 RNA methyltransferase [Mongoliitalea daihaiensis]
MTSSQSFFEYLSHYVTPHKRQLIEAVLAQRTRYFTVVLEDIYKPHNASAVLRTADCFGIQDIHIIEKEHSYEVNPYVVRGAAQWVDIHKHTNEQSQAVTNCFDQLRSDGYQIIATSPDAGSVSIHELDVSQKIALVFGNEYAGVSDEVKAKADKLVHIPMMGFTESFNISVAASIFLFDLIRKVQSQTNIQNFHLSEEEKQLLREKWYRGIVKNSAIHEKVFLNSNDM